MAWILLGWCRIDIANDRTVIACNKVRERGTTQ